MGSEDDFYKRILDNLSEGVYYVDRERRITYWNKAAENITGFSSEEVTGTHCPENLLMHINNDGESLCKKGCPLEHTITSGSSCEEELYLRHKDGHRVPVVTRTAPIRDDKGEVTGAVEIFSDNSAHQSLMQRMEDLQKLALFDYLTSLSNRRYLEIGINTRLSEMKRYNWQFGILFIDIDEFKQVNDHFGHRTGDEILKMVSRSLMHNIRPFDMLGRWGGEEFVAILVNIDPEQLKTIADKFRILVEKSSLRNGPDTIHVTVSIGGTLAREDDTVEALVQRADALMYQSKTKGRNVVTVDENKND